MSGGSWDYAYCKIEEIANTLRRQSCPKRKALGRLLLLVADAMHDIEWVDSSDYGPGDENASIERVFKSLEIDPKDLYKVEAFNEIAETIRRLEAK